MDKDKIQELLETRAQAEEQLEQMRLPVTILFSDIKGSSAYFEKKGDLEGMAMIDRSNSLMFPVIEQCGGRIVKTIGDAIMAVFYDPVGAVKAASGMQRALDADRKGRSGADQIHVRIGLHSGLGLEKDNDVFGDVVNAASRVQQQAEPDQILITDVLLEAARTAGIASVGIGRAELKGKEEQFDLYALAWSESVTDQLLEELRARFDRKLNEARRIQGEIEEEFESSRERWRTDRRNLIAEVERLEETLDQAESGAREKSSDDLQAELRFQLGEALRGRQQAEADLTAELARFELERNKLKAQIAGMQATVLEAMERANNPARIAVAIREQVETKVADAKEEWQLEWEGERRRLTAEIERLKNTPVAADEKKAAARRALLEQLGKLPPGSDGPAVKTAAQWEKEYEDSMVQWQTERDQLTLKIEKLERQLERSQDSLRNQIFQELHIQYEQKLVEANQERSRLQEEVSSLDTQLAEERRRLTSEVERLQQAIPDAQAAARKQVAAELQAQFDLKLEEANRIQSRMERRQQDAAEEWEAERRRLSKQFAALQEELKEAKAAVFQAQRARANSASALNQRGI